MTSILSNIGVNFTRKSGKKAGGGGASGLTSGQSPVGTGENMTPLGCSPVNAGPLSGLFSHPAAATESPQLHPQPHNISGLPHMPNTIVSSLKGGPGPGSTGSPTDSASPYESADETSSTSIATLATFGRPGAGAGGSEYLRWAASPERQLRYQECKLMVQLPNGYDKLEWLAYHATFLVRFVGMFWLSNGFNDLCHCSHLTAPGGTVWQMVDEKSGKKIAGSGGSGGSSKGASGDRDARSIIQTSLNNLEKILDNEEMFPSKYGNQFNNDFENLVRRCCRSLFCIVSHIIHSHHELVNEKRMEGALIDLFSYLITFVRQFSLLSSVSGGGGGGKKELCVLEDLESYLSRAPSIKLE